MAVKLAFNELPHWHETATGIPLSGGLLYTYVAGSTTPQTTYQDSAGSVAHANPIELDSRGEPPAAIWLTTGQTYKFVLKTAAGVTIWTADNISGINDATVSVDQWTASGLTPTYVSATSFTLSGDQTTNFGVGRELKTTNSGGTAYSTIASSTFGAVTTIVVINRGAITLDSGLSAVSYGLLSAANSALPSVGDEKVCQGRLTLETGVPISTSDQTAKETVYFTPFRGNFVDLYDSAVGRWVRFKFSELTLDVPDATQMNDVFIYLSSGVLTLEAVAWTDATNRATALTTQDGVLVKSGATARRYLGSFYGTTAGNGQTEDSLAKRYVWNYYNRAPRPMKVVEATNTWTYTTAAFHQVNASAANQLDMVVGVSEDLVSASSFGAPQNATVPCDVSSGIGVDSTSVNSAQIMHYNTIQVANRNAPVSAYYKGYPGIGKHLLVWLEYSEATGSTTWVGDGGTTYIQTGIVGELLG